MMSFGKMGITHKALMLEIIVYQKSDDLNIQGRPNFQQG